MPPFVRRFGVPVAIPLVLAVGVACVSPVLAAAGKEHSFGLPAAANVQLVSGAQEEQQRFDRRNTAAAKQNRRTSRDRYRRAGRAQAIALGRRVFPEVFAAPLFDGKHLAPGLDVVDYHGTNTAVAKTVDGRRLLLPSTMPLRARTPNGVMAPVDLSLRESATTFTTANSGADLQISEDASKGAEFLDSGLALAPETATPAVGTETANRVFYSETQTDTDFVVIPTPTGGEFSWLLRSPDAPQRLILNVDLPPGAVMRRAKSENPIPGDPPRSLEITHEGEAIAYVRPPVVYDADGVLVPAEMTVEGDDKIVITAKHREHDLRYPLYADPELYVLNNQWNTWNGWGASQVPTPASPGTNYYGFRSRDCAYNCAGPYMSMPTRTWFSGSGTGITYSFRAPSSTYIDRIQLAGLSHKPLRNGYTLSQFYDGMLNRAGTAWEPGVTWTLHNGVTGNNPFGAYAGALTQPGIAQTFCCESPNAINSGAADQNQFNLTLSAQYAGGAIYTYDYHAYLTAASAAVWLGDRHPPRLTGTLPTSKEWADDTDNRTHTQRLDSHDDGLGLNGIALSGAATGNRTSGRSCTGNPWTGRCDPDYGDTFNYTLHEGITNLNAQARDIVGNNTNIHSWQEKIDRTPPELDELQGALWAARNRGEDKRFQNLDDAGYTLQANASDSHSGVKEIEVYVDGQSQRSKGGYSAGTSLYWTLNTDGYDDGTYPVEVAVRDNVAGMPGAADSRHVTRRSFDVTIDRRGDVDRAVISSGDPAADGEVVSSDMSQRTSSRARSETGPSTSTRDIVPCSPGTSSNEFCGEERARLSDPDSGFGSDDEYSVIRGTSTTDKRLSFVSELKAKPEPTDPPTADGAIEDALEPWQRPPPGHGSLFIRFDTAFNDTTDDGTTVAVMQSAWFDKTTRLQLKRTTQVGNEPARRLYFDYSPRLTLEQAGSAFSVPRPESPAHEDETQYRETTPTVVSDDASGADFVPLTLGLVESVAGAVWCSATRQSFSESTSVDPAIAPAPDDPPSDDAPQPFTPITAYDEVYRLQPSIGDCNALDLLRGLLPEPLDVPSLTISAYARDSGEGRGWMDTYQEALADTPAGTERAGSQQVRLLGDNVVAIHLPLGNDDLAVMVPTATTVYTIKGRLVPTQITDLLELLSPATGDN